MVIISIKYEDVDDFVNTAKHSENVIQDEPDCFRVLVLQQNAILSYEYRNNDHARMCAVFRERKLRVVRCKTTITSPEEVTYEREFKVEVNNEAPPQR